MPRRPDVPCAGCGSLMLSSGLSAAPGQSMCLSCRRSRPGYRPQHGLRTPAPRGRVTCPICKQEFDQKRGDQRYCSSSCRERRVGFARISDRASTKRGYGYQHAKARKAAAQLHNPSDPCSRCRLPLGPMGPWLHYDHNGSRTGYLGFAHAQCNVKAGADLGRQRQKQSRQVLQDMTTARQTDLRW